MKSMIACGLVLVLIQGCSVLTPPKAKPVIEDRITEWGKQKVGVLATTPERRVVIVKMPDNRFCAEPPADAAENVSAALTAMAEASTKGALTNAQVGIANTLATSVKQLFQRSQGVQLYRDGSFMLCNAYLNGALTPEQFAQKHQELLQAVAPLITAEIPELHKQKLDTPPLPIPPNAPQAKFPGRSSSEKSDETGKETNQ